MTLTTRQVMRGIHGSFPPTICRVLPGETGVTIRDSKGFTLDGWTFDGEGSGVGLYLLDCEDVTLRNCRFSGLLNGLTTLRVKNLTVIGCDFGYMTGNGLILAATSGRIAGNLFHDFIATSKAHRDAGQLANDPPCSDIVFERNIVTGSCQGFFGKNVERVIVRDNQFRVAFKNAISLTDSDDVLLADNDMRSTEGSLYQAQAMVTGSTNVRFAGRNVAAKHVTPSGRTFKEISYPVTVAA